MIPARKGYPGGFWSKPRASGDDPALFEYTAYRRPVNPARAGMIHGGFGDLSVADGKPRASGDDPRARNHPDYPRE